LGSDAINAADRSNQLRDTMIRLPLTQLPRLCLTVAGACLLAGCTTTRIGTLEVLDPSRTANQSLYFVDDFHGESPSVESRLAADLREAFAQSGWRVEADSAKADLVVLPTLGRMKDQSTAPSAGPADTPFASRAGSVAGSTSMLSSSFSARSAVPSAQAPAATQQAGLLLSAVKSEDYKNLGITTQSLPPVWRVYVSRNVVQLNWKSVASPLVRAAAATASPLVAQPPSEGAALAPAR
jgi:hypothetical protein